MPLQLVLESACAVRFDIGPCPDKSVFVRVSSAGCVYFFFSLCNINVSPDRRDLPVIVDLRMRKHLDSPVITSRPVGDAHGRNSSWPSSRWSCPRQRRCRLAPGGFWSYCLRIFSSPFLVDLPEEDEDEQQGLVNVEWTFSPANIVSHLLLCSDSGPELAVESR
jgi:hypothetical protein